MVALSFSSALVNAFLGGGYGTYLVPFALYLGLAPVEVVPAVLFVHAIVNLIPHLIGRVAGRKRVALVPDERRAFATLLAFGVVGMAASTVLVGVLRPRIVQALVGAATLGVGALVALRSKVPPKSKASWYTLKRVGGVGLVAAFCKGLTGGGYGTLVAGGQVLCGVEGRSAAKVNSLSNGLLSALGVAFFVAGDPSALNPSIALVLLTGALPALPVARLIFRGLPNQQLVRFDAGLIVALGLVTLVLAVA
ncbi:MAG: hypothetical protein Kow0069_30280 [Promethearchaeota archaeon]